MAFDRALAVEEVEDESDAEEDVNEDEEEKEVITKLMPTKKYNGELLYQ